MRRFSLLPRGKLHGHQLCWACLPTASPTHRWAVVFFPYGPGPSFFVSSVRHCSEGGLLSERIRMSGPLSPLSPVRDSRDTRIMKAEWALRAIAEAPGSWGNGTHRHSGTQLTHWAWRERALTHMWTDDLHQVPGSSVVLNVWLPLQSVAHGVTAPGHINKSDSHCVPFLLCILNGWYIRLVVYSLPCMFPILQWILNTKAPL